MQVPENENPGTNIHKKKTEYIRFTMENNGIKDAEMAKPLKEFFSFFPFENLMKEDAFTGSKN